MKRDTATMILPGFLELIDDDGINKVSIKPEVRVAPAAQIIGCSADTVKRLIESGAIHGWRLSDRPNSLFKVCGACVTSWRLLRCACAAHSPTPLLPLPGGDRGVGTR
jgi:hypothetical protein